MIYKREKAHFWLNCVAQKRLCLNPQMMTGIKPPPGGGGHSPICPMRVCAAEQSMVFKVLRLNQGIQFHYLACWTGCLFGLEPFKERLWRLSMSGLHLQYQWFFFLNIYFHGFRVKNYLILYAKQNKSGSESDVSCLIQGSKMSNFCLKQGRGLKASAN